MFYHAIWDPWLIVGQLVLLWSAFYLLQGAWLCLFALAFGTPLRLAALLSPASLRLTVAAGWPALGAVLLSAPLFGYLLLPVVGRAKQCLDFATSVTALHTLLCWSYSGFPRGWDWWAAHVVSCAAAVLLGEYLCLQKELEAIPLGAEEREARERRALQQAQINAQASVTSPSAASGGEHPRGPGTAQERAGLLGSPTGGDGVQTTTIRLAPSNVFNV